MNVKDRNTVFEVSDLMYTSDSCIELIALTFMDGVNADGSARKAKKTPAAGFVIFDDFKKMMRNVWDPSMLCNFRYVTLFW